MKLYKMKEIFYEIKESRTTNLRLNKERNKKIKRPENKLGSCCN